MLCLTPGVYITECIVLCFNLFLVVSRYTVFLREDELERSFTNITFN